MSDIVLAAATWTALLATARRTKARADAFAALLPVNSTIELHDGSGLIRAITTGAWTVGSVQSDGRYPIRPGTFTDPETGTGTPTLAIVKDELGVEVCRMTAGVNEGVFRLGAAIEVSTPITGGTFVLLFATDDIPVAPPPEEPVVEDYVETLIADMALFHDGPCDVLEFINGWGSGAFPPDSYPMPAGWTHGLMWFHIMEDTENISGTDAARAWRVAGPYTGNLAPNTRIQCRDLQLWYLDLGGVWRLHGHNPRPGAYMPPISWGNESTALNNATWRDETNNGGGASLRDIGRLAYESHVWHAFTSPQTLPAHLGLASAFVGRKILDNPDGADDRVASRILGAGAGDYYENQSVADGSVPKTVGGNVRPMGYARMKYFSNDWQLFGFYSIRTLTAAQIRGNPPPFIGV